MPSASFGGGSVRVRTPRGYDAAPVPARERDLPPPGSDAERREGVLAALGDEDFEVVDRIELTPRRPRGLGESDPPAGSARSRGTVTLDVDVPADRQAVVLLERDGLYSWQLPVGRSRGLGDEQATVTFRIDVQADERPPRPHRRDRALEGPAPGTPSGTEPPAERGLVGDLVHGAVQAVVLHFVAPALHAVVDHLEASVRTGLVHVTGEALDTWRPVATLADVPLPTDRQARVLLLLHGTFSSTTGAFGALSLSPGTRGFVGTCVSAYDAVIGYDHRTLSLDPRQNAEDLLRRLSVAGAATDVVVDVVTHSRGGLVTRAFVEEVLPGSGWQGQVGTVVFVASTHAGTHLADPARWHDLVDLYTTLVTGTAAVLGLVPGGVPFAAVVGGVVKVVGSLVKLLATSATAGGAGVEVPGLAAMVPGGPFVTTLDAQQQGQPEAGTTSWYVVTSDFHADLGDHGAGAPRLPRQLAMRLAEGVLDDLFEGPNDLVVDVASMSAVGGGVVGEDGYVREVFALGTNDRVTHVDYFAQPEVVGRLSQWLPLGLGAGEDDAPLPEWMTAGEPEMTAAEPEATAAEPGPAGPPPLPDPDERARAIDLAPPDVPPSSHARTRAAPAAPAPAPEGTTAATLAAEMPSVLAPGVTFTVRVRLARGALTATEGTTSVEETVHVVAERPVSVQVLAKDNVEVLERAPKDFGLPSGDWASELTFSARPLADGPVAVAVVLRQGWVPVATVTLEATAGAASVVAPPPVSATVHPGTDAPELDGLPCLDIVECRRPTGERVYSYALRLEPGEEPRLFESEPVVGRDAFVRERIAEVEHVLRDPDLSAARRLKQLQNTGSLLFEQFFPEEMRAYLWQHRDAVDDLIVYTDEPAVPWELFHLKPPRGKRGVQPRFLAQGGLVRWQLGSFPPRRIPVRSGRVRTICPDYADPMFRNDVGLLEAAYLHERLGAKPVTATPSGVERVLRGGSFDLLHFSGHGAADVADIADAKVLLKGRRRGSEVLQQFLSSTDVSQNVAWASAGRPGPVVVLNACQTGRGGELFTTVGGFAKAFLDAGASAFVSCLWSVHEEPARVFVETLYDELLRGTTMSRATAAARAAARDAGDPTWLAYVVYARPDAVVERV